MKRVLLLLPLLAACGAQASAVSPYDVPLPTMHASPSVFEAGDSATETVDGQQVTLLVTGPSLANPVAGQPAQFASTLLETFTVQATVASGPAVTLGASDFSLHMADGVKLLDGPATVMVVPGVPQTWQLSVVEVPGDGLLRWNAGSTTLAAWSFVAEND